MEARATTSHFTPRWQKSIWAGIKWDTYYGTQYTSAWQAIVKKKKTLCNPNITESVWYFRGLCSARQTQTSKFVQVWHLICISFAQDKVVLWFDWQMCWTNGETGCTFIARTNCVRQFCAALNQMLHLIRSLFFLQRGIIKANILREGERESYLYSAYHVTQVTQSS